MRAACLSLLFPVLALAQMQDLATTDDGFQLYFSSTLRLKGTDQYTSPKIFRYTDGQFELFHQEKYFTPFLGSGKTNPYQLVSPDVSGDGQLVAYTAIAMCSGGSSCINFARNTGYLNSSSAEPSVLTDGTLRISRDKRYVLRFGGEALTSARNALIELSSGTLTDLTRYSIIGDGRQSLADNGVVLLSQNGGLSLWRNGSTVPAGINTIPLVARIDRKAGMIVYETGASGATQRLKSFNVAAGRETFLAEGYVWPTPRFRPSLSSDGTLVLYLDAQESDKLAQVFVQLTNGSGKRQLTHEPDGIVEAVLSGNGNVAFAVTSSATILRIDVGSGSIIELLSSPPQIRNIVGSGAGSFSRIKGVNLLDADLRVGLLLPPVLARTESEIDIQIPWETPIDSGSTVISASNKSAFESVFEIFAGVMAPRFESVVVHQGFDALVTPQNPAKPGEILHFYLTGLGAVTPPVATGQATPATELHNTVSQPDCSFSDSPGDVPAGVLFTGLAPRLIGIYQMDVMVPAGIILDPRLSCVFPTRLGTFTISTDNIPIAR